MERKKIGCALKQGYGCVVVVVVVFIVVVVNVKFGV
jgi:hypothetical protein